jgi:hypothetical protein
MTEKELNGIQSEFNVVLPSAYRNAMLNYPFPKGSWADDCAMPNNAGEVMGMNHLAQTIEIQSLSHHLQIGSDGSESWYFIDLRNDSCPVYTYELETKKVTLEAPDFESWLEQLREVDDEIKRDQIDMARKRWWQWWR